MALNIHINSPDSGRDLFFVILCGSTLLETECDSYPAVISMQTTSGVR